MLSRILTRSSELGSAAFPIAALVLAGSVFSSPVTAQETDEEMSPEPVMISDVLEQLNGLAVDEDGNPTGAPTYLGMMDLLHSSGLGAEFVCPVPEDEMAMELVEDEAPMPERTPITVFVPDDAAIGGLSDDVKERLASDETAAMAFILAHTIANDVSRSAMRNSQRWFTTMSGMQYQVSGLQGSTIVNPGGAAALWTQREHVLCADSGPVVVLLFVDSLFPFELPPEETAAS